jgi:tetratricopeptide (TPR) repeat protein
MYHWFLGCRGFTPPKTANTQSSQAALKALAVDEKLSEAHSMMAVLRVSDFDWQGAEREFRRALELDPRSEEAWQNYSRYYLVPMQRLEEAVAVSRKAAELDPLSAQLQYELGHRYWMMRQYDRAIDQFRAVLELDPQFTWAHMLLSCTYAQTGRFDEAVQAGEKGIQFGGRSALLLAIMGCTYAMAGRIKEAQGLLAELKGLDQKTYVPPISFAYLYLSLGELDQGFDWLEKAVEERDSLIFHIHIHPLFGDSLRSHPRYHSLMRKMNLIDRC